MILFPLMTAWTWFQIFKALPLPVFLTAQSRTAAR
jgi:hypothetical protein